MSRQEARLITIHCRQRGCETVIALIAPAAIVRTFTLCCPECRAQREIKPGHIDTVIKPLYTELVPV